MFPRISWHKILCENSGKLGFVCNFFSQSNLSCVVIFLWCENCMSCDSTICKHNRWYFWEREAAFLFSFEIELPFPIPISCLLRKNKSPCPPHRSVCEQQWIRLYKGLKIIFAFICTPRWVISLINAEMFISKTDLECSYLSSSADLRW